MPELFVVDKFLGFREAASYARQLAERFSCAISVERTDTEFLIKGPRPVFLSLKGTYEYARDEAEDEYLQQNMYDQWREEQDLLVRELSDGQDDWARSTEDGWFYAD